MSVVENYGGVISPAVAADILALVSVAMDAHAEFDTNGLSSCYSKASAGVRKYAGKSFTNAALDVPTEARAWTAVQWMLDDMLMEPYTAATYWANRVEELAAWFPEIAVQRWIAQGLDRKTSLIAIALEGV